MGLQLPFVGYFVAGGATTVRHERESETNVNFAKELRDCFDAVHLVRVTQKPLISRVPGLICHRIER